MNWHFKRYFKKIMFTEDCLGRKQSKYYTCIRSEKGARHISSNKREESVDCLGRRQSKYYTCIWSEKGARHIPSNKEGKSVAQAE